MLTGGYNRGGFCMRNLMKVGMSALVFAVIIFIGCSDAVSEPLTVSIADIQGVAAPVTGGVPVTEITDADQFTGTVSWSDENGAFNGGHFAADTVYTATITLAANDGFTFIGVEANFFRVAGAQASNEAGKGIITAVFPKTEDAAPVPEITITTQPASSVNYIIGGETVSLTVAAVVSEDGTTAYQWYKNTENSNAGGFIVEGAESATFEIPETLEEGYHYYFAEISADNAVSVRSIVSTVIVSATAVPVINIDTHPAETTTVTEGSITGSLTVAASVTEGGTPAYLWYSNETASNEGGTSTGITTASFTIPSTLTEGIYYYFAQVSAQGALPVRSSVATVIVSAPAAPVITITTQPAATTTVTAGNITGSLTVAASVTEGGTPAYLWTVIHLIAIQAELQQV